MREAYPDEGGGQTKPIVKNTLVKTTNHKQAVGLANDNSKPFGLLLTMLQNAIYEKVREIEEKCPTSDIRSGRVEGLHCARQMAEEIFMEIRDTKRAEPESPAPRKSDD